MIGVHPEIQSVLVRQIEAQLHSAGLFTLSAVLLREHGFGDAADRAEHHATEAWERAVEVDALLVWLSDRS